jgi:hypothetical protein
LYKNGNLKAEDHETVIRKLKEINQDSDREMTAKRTKSLIENPFRQFKVQ